VTGGEPTQGEPGDGAPAGSERADGGPAASEPGDGAPAGSEQGDAELVEAANAALYEAFETADVDRMAALWDDADPDSVVCVHPGWPMLRGRGHVLRSWSAVMAGTDYIQFFLTDVHVSIEGDTAVVTCTENVVTAVDDLSGAGGAVAATNVFRRRPGGWRMQVHHGSPVLGRLE
jgi:ketosteroid isomerase-like protein